MQDTTNSSLPKLPRRWPLVVAAAALVIVAALWFRASPQNPDTADNGGAADTAEAEVDASASIEIEPDMQRIAGIAVEPARTQQLSETIQTTAVVGPDESRVARVRPLADGRVLEVSVRVGDHVRNGQSLLTYDSITAGELFSDYRIALASLERANAGAEAQRRSVERADKLFDLTPEST